MKISEPSTLELFSETELQSTQSAEAFHAKTLAQREKVQELKANAQAYGLSMPDLLANYDPASCSWRTSQHCLVEGLTVYSETWPRSGMMRNGTAYLLPPLVLLTDVTASGLWRTPSAQASGILPERLETKSGNAPKRGERLYDKRTGRNAQFGLEQQVRFWPTPTASEGTGAQPNTGRTGGKSLREAVMYPTPTASMYKGSSAAALTRANGRDRSNDRLDHCLQASEGSGSLNPNWVEWLMGFPIGHTDLKPSETP
jgi:DNA (cytosine-5)-methyltransferase 1